jgi:hypothetical protein
MIIEFFARILMKIFSIIFFSVVSYEENETKTQLVLLCKYI